MDGIHDMGGMHGFGPIPRESDYVFRADWQRRAFALVEALSAVTPFNADTHRRELERIPAADYLQRDYFEKWIMATEALLIEAGLVSREELDRKAKLFDPDLEGRRPISAADLVAAMKGGAPLVFPADSQPAGFAVGQRARVKNDHPYGHTRAPRYLRGQVGEIVADCGVFQFADAVARNEGPAPQHSYTLRFASEDLWGSDAEPGTCLYADLWESYLEPA